MPEATAQPGKAAATAARLGGVWFLVSQLGWDPVRGRDIYMCTNVSIYVYIYTYISTDIYILYIYMSTNLYIIVYVYVI